MENGVSPHLQRAEDLVRPQQKGTSHPTALQPSGYYDPAFDVTASGD